MNTDLIFTYIGGATALIELAGVRFLTDPTFDPAGAAFTAPIYVLERTTTPALSVGAVLPVDVVLLSHDHHFDNLDNSGRAFLPRAGKVLTTKAGAERLDGNSVGMNAWESQTIVTPDGNVITITATPARHGPADGDRGPVIGFVLTLQGHEDTSVYVAGDTVWYEGVEEVSRRFRIKAAVLFLGAARIAAVGPSPLTMTAEEAVQAAQALPGARIIPLHFEGWKHFSEGRVEIENTFRAAHMEERLVWGIPGVRIPVHGLPAISSQ